jgi:hypothetical protein
MREIIFIYLFTPQMGVLPGGSGSTIRHITQNYRNNEGHTIHNEYSANTNIITTTIK